MSRVYLVTGGAGFIGSNFVRYLLRREEDARVINLDSLTYAGVQATVDELDEEFGKRHRFVRGDIRDPELADELMGEPDAVVHFAAESMVDRSIRQPMVFLEANVVGTGVLLEAALRNGIGRFVHVSTDEVYGSVTEGFATEDWPLDPSSPYSSSKAGSDLLVNSYWVTFGLPAVITRCTNNYGPYQLPEKVIPLFITNALEGERLPVYGNGANERDWLHVLDHCRALHKVLHHGRPGQIYNIGADAQLDNLTLTRTILELLELDESYIEFVPDRPGHDHRYAVDSSRVRALGWEPKRSFREGLAETIHWYRTREDWWRPLKERLS